MKYARNYLNTASLADRIRSAASQGKTEKPSGGLAGRESQRKTSLETPDFHEVRAQYMNLVRDLFAPAEEEKTTKPKKEELSFGLGSPLGTEQGEFSLGREPDGRDFLSRLIHAESSGNPQAVYKTADGRSFVGLVQIGDARLQDYNKATGSNLEQADLLQKPELQNDVINWHINDLTKAAQALAKETGMDVQGLVAVGHLGGRSGMAKFAKSGGKYNVSDELGTSLMDYYTRFKA